MLRSKIILFGILLTVTPSLYAQFQLETGPNNHFSTISPPKTSGLETVYVVEDASGCRLTYRSSGNTEVIWKKFSSLGGGYAETFNGVTINGTLSSITIGNDDCGYIVEDNGRQLACWVTNYANHIPDIISITVSPESDCDRVTLIPTGSFDRMNYYSINGQPLTIDRKISIEYNSLQENNEKDGWTNLEENVGFTYITGPFTVEGPLCDTQFHLIGDCFLTEWGDPISLSTESFTAKRVSAITSATQSEHSADNESSSSTEGGLGGSAPCEITFFAVPTDAAVFKEWQFSNTEDFDDILDRYNQNELTHTFDEYGTFYVRFTAADAAGECTFDSEVYTISIGASKLECPNAFSPLNEDGINDEWKVSYSSLVSYECHIFNRWGQKVFSSSNPADGWDGRLNGKFVKPGVFFYVIKAKGADGHNYNLSGDINIVGSRLNPNATGSTD